MGGLPGQRLPPTETSPPPGQRPPLYTKEWVVRILLECILVLFCNLWPSVFNILIMYVKLLNYF